MTLGMEKERWAMMAFQPGDAAPTDGTSVAASDKGFNSHIKVTECVCEGIF